MGGGALVSVRLSEQAEGILSMLLAAQKMYAEGASFPAERLTQTAAINAAICVWCSDELARLNKKLVRLAVGKRAAGMGGGDRGNDYVEGAREGKVDRRIVGGA